MVLAVRLSRSYHLVPPWHVFRAQQPPEYIHNSIDAR